MAFDRAGFTQTARAMGYSEEEINAIASIKESQANSPENEMKDIQLQQARLNLQQDQQKAQTVTQPVSSYFTPQATQAPTSRPDLTSFIVPPQATQTPTPTQAPAQAPQASYSAPEEAVRNQSFISKVGKGVLDFGKAIVSAPQKLGSATGEAINYKKDQLLNKKQVKDMQEQLDKNNALISSYTKKGNMEAAQRFINVNNRIIEEMKNVGIEQKERAYAGPAIEKKAVKGAIGTGAFLMPGGGSLATKVGTGVMAGGMAGYGASEEGQELPSIIGGAAVGGALPLAIGAVGKLIKPPVQTKVGENILQKAGKSLKQQAAPIYEPASVYGASKEEAIRKSLDELKITGTPQDQYTKLQPAMKKLSTTIDNNLKANPKLFSYSDIISNFKNNVKSLTRSKVINDTQAIKEIRGYLKDLSGLKDGDFIKSDKLFKLKKVINSDYGSVANKIERGLPLTPREHIISMARQTIDDIIAKAHPDVKKLTIQQSHLFDAAESLNRARKTVPTVRVMGTTVPAQLSAKIIDKTGRMVEGAGNKVENISSSVNKFRTEAGGNIIDAASQKGVLPGIVSSMATPRSQDNLQDQAYQPENQGGYEQTDTDLNTYKDHMDTSVPQTRTGYTLDQLAQARSQALMQGDKTAADALQEMYKMEQEYQKEVKPAGGKQLSATAAKEVSRTLTAKNNLKLLEEQIQSNPNIILQSAIPGSPGARQYRALWGAIIDAIGTGRTGAAYTKEQRKDYEYLLPKVGDSSDTVNAKIQNLRQEFDTYVDLMQNTTSTELPTIQ